ncbi:hypothetical protein [Kordiimonas sp.]|uniref:hypothetical protein n=1 Tax=Kordiimonas sp. TaxID=1970157 RepID=UPI003A959169
MTAIIPPSQAALLALLKQPNMNAARLPDLSGSGRFQAELLSFQRSETMSGQTTTQLVSGVRPSVFLPDATAATSSGQSTTQKRDVGKKKDKANTAGHATAPARPRR